MGMGMRCQDVLCIDSPSKPFPKLVESNIDFLRKVLETGEGRVLDIGAGHGRFVHLFRVYKLPVKKYIAVEPCAEFTFYLRGALDCLELDTSANVLHVDRKWQEVRSELLQEDWDIIIAWDVFMYMDLRRVHSTDSFREAVVREIAELIRRCKVLLLSFWTDRRGLPGVNGYTPDGRRSYRMFTEIVQDALKLAPEGKIYAKFHHQNYIIVNTEELKL